MVNTINYVSSGFKFIDNNWGGLYQGGSYLVIGKRKCGKSTLALQLLKEWAGSGTCLYFTTKRQKDLLIQSATLNFDFQSYLEEEKITLIRLLLPPNDKTTQGRDDYLSEYFKDIIELADEYKPSAVIFDEITEFINFNNVDSLKSLFLKTVEHLEDKNITSLILIGEIPSPKRELIIDTLCDITTGVIRLNKEKDGSYPNKGIVTIKPNMGHVEGMFSGEYVIEPGKGIVTSSANNIVPGHGTTPSSKRLQIVKPDKSAEKEELNDEYELTDEEKAELEEISFSNIYEYTDFLLIFNMHIALYMSTGQKFDLLCFKLDPKAEDLGLISLEQFRNSVISSTEKKDKICFIENTIFVLVVGSNRDMVNSLTEKVQIYLTDSKRSYNNESLDYVSVYNKEADGSIENSESLITEILNTGNMQEPKFIPLKNYFS